MNIVRIIALFSILTPLLAFPDVKMPKMPQGHDVSAPRKKLAYERNKEESERVQKKAAFEERQKNRKKRKRQLNPRLKAERVTFRNMSPEQLRTAADTCKAKQDLASATVFLDQLIKVCDDGFQEDKASYIVELADIYFAQGDYEEASKKYNEFLHVYPGNKAVEHASYRAVVCCSKGILSPDRDQTKTEETLALANKFLERGDMFKAYRKEVEAIKQSCLQTLAASELNVGAFYVTMGDFKAAQQRIAHIKTEWLPKIEAPTLEFTLANLEMDLAERFPEFKPSTPSQTSNLTIASSKPAKKIDLVSRF